MRRARSPDLGPPLPRAVLPLANISADPENEYFSDGMTEEIINALAKVPGVQVASRTSSFAFKGKKDVDIREIGEKLGVTSVLEGSVRKVGNRIRITAQLVNVENGYQLWSETYDRQLEDVFAVQDEISRAIVEALKLRLVDPGAHLVAPTKNLEAYTLYLKGRYNYNKFSETGLRKGLDFFQQALLQDPGFARAYAGIADVWCDLADDWVAPDDAYPRAKSAAERALQRDPELAEAMISIGKVLCWHEWKFADAERQMQRAVVLSPNNATAHYILGTALPLVGRLNEGIDELRKALVLDPLYAHLSSWLARFLLYAKDYAGAIAQGEKTLEIEEDDVRAFVFIGSAHLALGDAEAALEWYQRWPGTRQRSPLVRRDDRARAGRPRQARRGRGDPDAAGATSTSGRSTWRWATPRWATSIAPSTRSNAPMRRARAGSSTCTSIPATSPCEAIRGTRNWWRGSASSRRRDRPTRTPRSRGTSRYELEHSHRRERHDPGHDHPLEQSRLARAETAASAALAAPDAPRAPNGAAVISVERVAIPFPSRPT